MRSITLLAVLLCTIMSASAARPSRDGVKESKGSSAVASAPRGLVTAAYCNTNFPAKRNRDEHKKCMDKAKSIVRCDLQTKRCNSYMIPVDAVPRVSAGRLVIGI